MSEPFIGEIRIFAGNFAPRGWAFCNGQLMPISQNTALFSLLGTNFGGDGRSTFGLPDLQGRVPIHEGQSPGLSNYQLGQTGGSETATLQLNNVPAHTHGIRATGAAANQAAPANNSLPATASGGRGQQGPSMYAAAGGATTTLSPQALAPAGSSLPVNIMKPVQAVSYIIALQGIFPQRP